MLTSSLGFAVTSHRSSLETTDLLMYSHNFSDNFLNRIKLLKGPQGRTQFLKRNLPAYKNARLALSKRTAGSGDDK